MPETQPLPLVPAPRADEALRAGIREFLAEWARDPSHAALGRSWLSSDPGLSRALGAHGWLGLTFPVEYGGGGRGAFARFVVSEELLAVGAPVGAHWIADRQSGPQILKYGTEQQKQFFIPSICRGEAFFCIGMSEPGSGSDLAGVRTRAIRTSTGWRLNGQKLWTTNAPHCHYMIALVRTSGTAGERHAGLSQMIVDLKRPGVIVRPIADLNGDAHLSEVFFDEVDLPEDALLGAEGSGWSQVLAELAFERSGPERFYSNISLCEAWLAWIRERGAATDGELVLAGKLASHLAVLRSMSLSITSLLEHGASPVVEAALVKDLGTEFEQYIPDAIAALAGGTPNVALPPQLARMLANITQISPSYSLRGGTREILRGMIARGLGLR